MNDFEIGDRIKNICQPKSGQGNYGELGEVVDIDGDTVYVEYDNGDDGHSKNPSKYYQIINTERVFNKKSVRVEDRSEKPVNNIKKFVKSMLMTADDRLLVAEGLMSECGVYTQESIDVVLQDLCAENKARLVEVATAIKADRKDQKDNR